MDILELFQKHGDNLIWFLLGNASLWLLTKIIPAWIKFSYDRRLEVFKRKILQRDKASLIAELVPLMRLTNLNDDQKLRINTIFSELSLYLPKEIVVNMAHTSVGTGHKENIGWSDLFGDIRDYLNGNYRYCECKKRNINTKDRVVGDNIVFISDNKVHSTSNPNSEQVTCGNGKRRAQLDVRLKKFTHMKIQGVEIPEDEIYHAYGSWELDKHCVIVIIMNHNKDRPFHFSTVDPTEANEMNHLLTQAVMAAQKNCTK